MKIFLQTIKVYSTPDFVECLDLETTDYGPNDASRTLEVVIGYILDYPQGEGGERIVKAFIEPRELVNSL